MRRFLLALASSCDRFVAIACDASWRPSSGASFLRSLVVVMACGRLPSCDRLLRPPVTWLLFSRKQWSRAREVRPIKIHFFVLSNCFFDAFSPVRSLYPLKGLSKRVFFFLRWKFSSQVFVFCPSYSNFALALALSLFFFFFDTFRSFFPLMMMPLFPGILLGFEDRTRGGNHFSQKCHINGKSLANGFSFFCPFCSNFALGLCVGMCVCVFFFWVFRSCLLCL